MTSCKEDGTGRKKDDNEVKEKAQQRLEEGESDGRCVGEVGWDGQTISVGSDRLFDFSSAPLAFSFGVEFVASERSREVCKREAGIMTAL